MLSWDVTFALPKAKSLKLSPLNGSTFSSGLFSVQRDFMRVYSTGRAEQGNPSLHGRVGMTDANMLLLSPDTDPV